jgi:hypothetical protein
MIEASARERTVEAKLAPRGRMASAARVDASDQGAGTQHVVRASYSPKLVGRGRPRELRHYS